MQRKVAWLFVWTTLTFWLGCGENQNYRINQEEDEPLLVAPEPAQSSAEPSLKGIDRSHWERVTVAPVSGKVSHHPYYFKREFFGGAWTLNPDRPSPLFLNDPEHSIVAATGDDRYTIGLRDVGDLGMSPLKYAMDLVTLPVRAAVFERPWQSQTSPQEQSPKVE